MDWHRMPPLSALRAFAAYAETGSVAEAGVALNVSHAAISQQLRTLETAMGLRLLDRSARAMSLTAEGKALAFALHEGFGTIAETVATLTGGEEERPLHVSCTPSFAANWLMPRLARFRADQPGIDLVIDPNPALTDPVRGGIDIALRYGPGTWPGLETEFLVAAPMMVVGAPELFPDGPPSDPAALVDLPWLQELGLSETTAWLRAHGVTMPQRGTITEVPGNLMLDGARRGQGVAITTRLAVCDDLASGRLLAVFEDAGPGGYFIVTRPGVQRFKAKAFVRWLRREVARQE